MNFDFSEEQKLIQSEAKKFLKERCDLERVRQIMDDENLTHDATLWEEVIKLGWPAIAIGEEYGGLGLGYLELCVLAQEMGRALAPIPFASSIYLFSEALKLSDDPELRAKLLPKIASGEHIGCVAIVEQAGAAIGDRPNCTVNNGKVTGVKPAVTDGEIANSGVVSAVSANSEIRLYLVDLTHSSVEKQAVNTLDPSRPHANLTFNDSPAEEVKLDENCLEFLRKLYDKAAVLMAFEQVGGAEACLKMGLSYTQQRFAFGRQVASFQAIKHKFADMFVANEIAKANAYYAAWALSSNAPELPLAAATARVSASEAYFLSAKENLQAHGGMGYTWEFDCHLYYRRAQALSLMLGGMPYWKDRLAEQLLADEQLQVVEA